MKTKSHSLHYHTWKDIGGPFGLAIDFIFCAGIVLAALFMIVVGSGLVLLDYLVTPVVGLFRHKF